MMFINYLLLYFVYSVQSTFVELDCAASLNDVFLDLTLEAWLICNTLFISGLALVTWIDNVFSHTTVMYKDKTVLVTIWQIQVIPFAVFQLLLIPVFPIIMVGI